ncbi:MAG: S41 family peptidase [Thermoguttaceae bacterium]
MIFSKFRKILFSSLVLSGTLIALPTTISAAELRFISHDAERAVKKNLNRPAPSPESFQHVTNNSGNAGIQNGTQARSSEHLPGIDSILDQGLALENERYWSDALQLYEKALKSYVNNPSLRSRHQNARFHYEINRRYRDSSFEQLVKNKSLIDIIDLFNQIFTYIQMNHVDSPDLRTLFDSGLDDLEIALTEPEFLAKNNIDVGSEKIQPLCKKLRETAAPWAFRDVQDMRNGALHLADIAHDEIGLSPSAVLMEFVCGAAFSLDPHTSYLSLRQLNDVYSMIEGCFVGIGVELDADDISLIILKVHPGSPADEAGLRDGDRILAVDRKSTEGIPLDTSADFLQGEAGSVVEIAAKTIGEPERVVRITRREIEVASVEDVHMIDGGLGYIRLTCFQASTVKEIQAALTKLNSQGMKSLVLDLRQNPGGLFDTAVDVVNLFIDKGVIVRTQNRNTRSETVSSATTSGTWNMPLFILIDEESASASEIFAGAIRDHKRGIIIGKQSYGKGTVQMIYRINSRDTFSPVSGLKLTVQRFYSPNGLSFCDVGVTPDIWMSDENFDENVTVAKPNTTGQGKIAKNTQPRRKRISSSPEDPFVSAAISENHRLYGVTSGQLSQLAL